jgi:heat-inducible transcriptional repressor
VLIVRGQSNLLDETAAADLDRVRSLLDELESTESDRPNCSTARARRGDAHFHRRRKTACSRFRARR